MLLLQKSDVNQARLETDKELSMFDTDKPRVRKSRVWSVIMFSFVWIGGGLDGLTGPAKAANEPSPPNVESIPVTGEILPGSEQLARLDGTMREILARYQVPGAGLAITYHGKLIVARSYGWADVEAKQPVEPTTLFGLASVSKAITAVTALKLVEEDRLQLDERVLELLGMLRAPPGREFDPRLRTITLQILLEHAGGWDRTKSGDPSTFSQRVQKELNVPLPITIDQLIYYMNGQPLDFTPGTQQRYSNFGFSIVGRAIAQITGRSYPDAVEHLTLQPMGIRGIQMPPTHSPEKIAPYLPGESKRYLCGTTKPLEGGHVLNSAAAGGWCGSPVALARFLTAIDGTRTGETFLKPATMQEMLAKPKPPLSVRKNGSWFGLGWDSVREMPNWPHSPKDGSDDLAYSKNGGLPGISTWIQHLPGGIDWVVLFNGSKNQAAEAQENDPAETPKSSALADAQKEVVEILRGVDRWPGGDLFEKYK